MHPTCCGTACSGTMRLSTRRRRQAHAAVERAAAGSTAGWACPAVLTPPTHHACAQALKKRAPGLKTLIAIGGWSFNDLGPNQRVFGDMVATAQNRALFIRNALAFTARYGFDGWGRCAALCWLRSCCCGHRMRGLESRAMEHCSHATCIPACPACPPQPTASTLTGARRLRRAVGGRQRAAPCQRPPAESLPCLHLTEGLHSIRVFTMVSQGIPWHC